jgi:CheY-like chemotaxis protein/anti-sigma regulatory factor (Ser/Thr protein kinase)
MTDVLVVDDSPIDRRLMGKLLEADSQLRVTFAEDGRQALERMAIAPPDIVVTDLLMPRLDGFELVAAVRKQYPLVPVIVVTGQGSEQIAVKALEAGAASYLPKTQMASELVEVVQNVLATAKAGRRHDRLMHCLAESHWSFVLENDPGLVPVLVEHARQDLVRAQLCDETTTTRLGIAFHEALTNAIDHGNLELSSTLREQDDKAFRELREKRRVQPPYSLRRVYVTFKVTNSEAVWTIRDEGPGFNPNVLPDPTDPANLEKVCGRGLLLVRTFMDEVHHNSPGNEITMVKRRM